MNPSLPSPSPKHFDLVCSLFVAVYLISQVSSAKLFAIGPFQFPGGIIIFPIAYIFGDILTEVYGYNLARRSIWLGFCAALLMSAVLLIVQQLPAAPAWGNQRAYESILGFVPRITVASIAAYWMGEFANSYVLARMKILTRGRWLWTRTVGSTVVGQAVDSVVFGTVALTGVVPPQTLLTIILSIYLFKVAYEVVATPLTYIVVNHLKRIEGIDVFDYETKFSPFRFQ
jgi:queuosine precursor transporter